MAVRGTTLRRIWSERYDPQTNLIQWRVSYTGRLWRLPILCITIDNVRGLGDNSTNLGVKGPQKVELYSIFSGQLLTKRPKVAENSSAHGYSKWRFFMLLFGGVTFLTKLLCTPIEEGKLNKTLLSDVMLTWWDANYRSISNYRLLVSIIDRTSNK